MTFFVATLLGALIAAACSGKHEGDRLEYSMRFLVKGHFVHIHHWIWCTALIIMLLLCEIQDPFILGALLGALIQGLTYRDRFVVLYKKEKFEEIYSRFK